jgi:hypothetical protein
MWRDKEQVKCQILSLAEASTESYGNVRTKVISFYQQINPFQVLESKV